MISDARYSHQIPGMKFPQNFRLLFRRNMYVDLRCVNRTVPQDPLHAAHINPFFNQIGCKRMPKHMRRYIPFYSSQFTVFLQHQPHGLFCISAAAAVDKKISAPFRLSPLSGSVR